MKVSQILTAAVVAGMMASVVHATVTTVGYWRMGEGDAGAAAGGAVTTAVDQTGNFNLSTMGNVTYSSDTRVEGSGLSVYVAGASGMQYSTVVSTASDCFGMEAWVKVSDTSPNINYGFLANGRGGPGFGSSLFIWGNGDQKYTVHNHGIALWTADSTPVSSDWVHYAVVRDNNTFGTRLYLNGVMILEIGASTLRAPLGENLTKNEEMDETWAEGTGIFAIGGGLGNNGMDGAQAGFWIDEARYFTFNAGAFDASDLFFALPVPEPTSLSLLALAGMGMLIRRRS